jgi:hypothetical protein
VDEDHRAISEMLDREWDPIGVYEGAGDEQAPPGEYLSYAGWILESVRSGGGRGEIRAIMHRALVNMEIGASTTEERAARLILEWWRSNH